MLLELERAPLAYDHPMAFDVDDIATKIRAVLWKIPCHPPERVRVEELEDGGRQIVIRFRADEVEPPKGRPGPSGGMGRAAGWENPTKR